MEQYHHRHPTATDVLLLVEVAKSSLELDRTVKLPIYAKQGIAEVWIVDINADAVEGHGAIVVKHRRGRG